VFGASSCIGKWSGELSFDKARLTKVAPEPPNRCFLGHRGNTAAR
jgi:hypothetical protein